MYYLTISSNYNFISNIYAKSISSFILFKTLEDYSFATINAIKYSVLQKTWNWYVFVIFMHD